MPVIPRLPIADQTWQNKYRFSGNETRPLDRGFQDSWRRVAKALSDVEKPEIQAFWFDKFYNALYNFKFLPAGRILAGSGTGRKVTLHNCFVMGTIEDDLKAIFDGLGEAAVTMQAGGGIGYDFSTLRPKGALVAGVGADASGPLSFMDVWDSMCRTIMSAGSRRGAMMATLRCDHPDIEDFVTAKKVPGRLTNFNLSVLVTDPFMEAVKNDLDWELQFKGKTYKTIKAKELWSLIMQTTYEVAEPGVIFIDQINRRNNLYYCESISATNPCGEQPLPPYGTCLLGSINFAALVKKPFTENASLDIKTLRETITSAVRMMDNVVEASKYPVAAQEHEAKNKRRIGLGITGLADALAMCGLVYGSLRAVAVTQEWMNHFQSAAYLTSIGLAREKGPFPLYDKTKYLAGETIRALPQEVQKELEKHGIRNALVTSIAPTGTISLYADNISSGVEPIFALEYTRKTLQPDGTRLEETVTDYAVRMWHHTHRGQPLPPVFVTAQDLKVDAHLAMQAAVQNFIDSSISKTINVPADYPFEDFEKIYSKAYAMGCKGCTTYRPSGTRGSVLSVTGVDGSEIIQVAAKQALGDNLIQRTGDLNGVTSKLKWRDDPSYYLTLNSTSDGKPFEIFINSKSTVHTQWIAAVTRLATAIFRRGGNVSFLAEQLIEVTDPNGGAWINGKYVPSLVAMIGYKLREQLERLGIRSAEPVVAVPEITGKPEPGEGPEVMPLILKAQQVAQGEVCPKCSAPTLHRKEGCKTCDSCGYSSCG